MRINNSGSYEPCRWMTRTEATRVDHDMNIKNLSPLTYFQSNMSGIRKQLLAGGAPDICTNCHVMEQHGKPSGRQRQLLKVGVQTEYFEKSLASSTLKAAFDHSQSTQGHTARTVSDWQIDLGNYCNGACVFCYPESSSMLATEFKKLGIINQLPPRSWCDDPVLLDKFVDDLSACQDLQYLHFLGGETLITPGFKKILTTLVDKGLAGQVSIGFTTNLTTWSDSVVELLTQFAQVNLGMSIETLSTLNDYARYPSKITQVRLLLDRWTDLAQQHNWLIQLRITPTCLTVHELTQVYDYAWDHNVSVESCNFISHPEFFRISVLPDQQRQQVIADLENWISTHKIDSVPFIVNTRDPNLVREQIVQDLASYLHYLKTAPDESHRLPDLVDFLKLLESNRGNSILDHIPEYENLFRSAGY